MFDIPALRSISLSVLMLPQSGTCQQWKPDGRQGADATHRRYSQGFSFETRKEDLRVRCSTNKLKSQNKTAPQLYGSDEQG